MISKVDSVCRVLIGGAGAPNYGDELIVKAWLDHFQHPGFSANHFTLEENTGNVSKAFHLTEGHPLSSRARFSNRYALLAKEIQNLTFWQQVERGFNFISSHGISNLGFKQPSDLLKISSFHLHGGGYFNEIRGDKGFYLGLAASLQKLYQIPVFATGIGFGPFRSECHDRSLFEEIMSHFQLFEVRDPEGYSQLKNLAPSARIIDGIDDCFVLPTNRLFRADSQRHRLHLSLNSSHIQTYKDSFWSWLREQASSFEEVLFWESFPWKDKEVIARICSEIPSCQVLTTSDLVHKTPPIGGHDVFLTHRFHVHFAAARAGARGFYIAPCRYYKQKHQSIVKLGSGLTPLDFDLLPKLNQATSSQPLDESGLHHRKFKVVFDCYPNP